MIGRKIVDYNALGFSDGPLCTSGSKPLGPKPCPLTINIDTVNVNNGVQVFTRR